MSERMSAARLEIIRSIHKLLGDFEWKETMDPPLGNGSTWPRICKIRNEFPHMLDEIDALKAEMQDGIYWHNKCLEAEAEVVRLRGAYAAENKCRQGAEKLQLHQSNCIDRLEAEVARLRALLQNIETAFNTFHPEHEIERFACWQCNWRHAIQDALRAGKQCDHVWGIDGMHSNEYCKKCFAGKDGE